MPGRGRAAGRSLIALLIALLLHLAFATLYVYRFTRASAVLNYVQQKYLEKTTNPLHKVHYPERMCAAILIKLLSIITCHMQQACKGHCFT